MTYRDFCRKLDELSCTCDINQRYHQILSWRWRIADRLAKIAVALVATVAFAAEFWSHEYHTVAVALAGLGALLAILLNVVPFGEQEKDCTEMFRAWSDLRTDVDAAIVKLDGDDDKQVPGHALERLAEFRTKQKTLDSKEPAPWRGLLTRCQEDSNEAHWGKGIRTSKDIASERVRRSAAIASEAGAAARPAS